MNEAPSSGPAGGAAFATTHLPAVFTPLLADLCRDYWTALYSFVRGRGYGVAVAAGIVHEFVHELAADSPGSTAGSVRPFLLAALKYHLFRRQDRDPEVGPKTAGPPYLADADLRCAEDALAAAKTTATAVGEDQLFDWRWAEVLVRRALEALSGEYNTPGRRGLLAALHPFLAGGTGVPVIADTARQLGMPSTTVETELTALRARYGEALRREVTRTVDRAEQVADELKQLCRTLAGGPTGA